MEEERPKKKKKSVLLEKRKGKEKDVQTFVMRPLLNKSAILFVRSTSYDGGFQPSYEMGEKKKKRKPTKK